MLENIKTAFRALKYRNFRLFFAGQSLSLIGTWMQHIAISWLVYRLTESAFMLGAVAFVTQIPMFFLSLFAGAYIDRYDRRKILIITQSALMFLAGIFAVFTFLGHISIPLIFVLGFMVGVINTVDMPARQSFVIILIENKEDIGNAIALNSILFNISRLIGPSLAGIIIAAYGEAVCFSVNSMSYITIISALLIINTKDVPPEQNTQLTKSIKEGILYAYRSVPIREILLLLSITSLMGMSYTALLPIFAKEILKGGAENLGFLMSSAGFGALFGAWFLAARKDIRRLENVIPVTAIIFGLSLCVFAFSTAMWLSMISMAFAGLGIMVQIASSNTLLMAMSEEDKRGRIMSFYAMAFMGFAPIGSLLGGSIAQYVGVQKTIFFGGLCIIIFAFHYMKNIKYFNKEIKTIFEKNGILPDINNTLRSM